MFLIIHINVKTYLDKLSKLEFTSFTNCLSCLRITLIIVKIVCIYLKKKKIDLSTNLK